jgi:hypothetical protein
MLPVDTGKKLPFVNPDGVQLPRNLAKKIPEFDNRNF